jgi:hypothetical protein
MHQEDAMKNIIQWMREELHTAYSNYGYDLYVPNIIRAYLISIRIHEHNPQAHQLTREFAPVFFDAAWELCRRGIIRPGVRNIGEQATPDGSAGSGCCITPFGKRWVQEANPDLFVPTEQERFTQMIAPYEY